MKKIILTLLLVVGLAGCGTDADPGTRDTGAAKARINMPDKFPNVAFKCRGSKGIYVSNNTSVGAGNVVVVLDDPECPKS
jgi:hypothetical protein